MGILDPILPFINQASQGRRAAGSIVQVGTVLAIRESASGLYLVDVALDGSGARGITLHDCYSTLPLDIGVQVYLNIPNGDPRNGKFISGPVVPGTPKAYDNIIGGSIQTVPSDEYRVVLSIDLPESFVFYSSSVQLFVDYRPFILTLSHPATPAGAYFLAEGTSVVDVGLYHSDVLDIDAGDTLANGLFTASVLSGMLAVSRERIVQVDAAPGATTTSLQCQMPSHIYSLQGITLGSRINLAAALQVPLSSSRLWHFHDADNPPGVVAATGATASPPTRVSLVEISSATRWD